MINGNGKTLAEVVLELKNELRDFVGTRVAMLRAEMGEKLATVKTAAPMIVMGLVLLVTAWFVLTACLISLIATLFSATQWNYVIALAIVGLFYLLLGGAVAMAGWKRMTSNSLKPERTLRTLKQDQIWLQTEAKTQL